jgi:small-conductance mechanosensitive channel
MDSARDQAQSVADYSLTFGGFQVSVGGLIGAALSLAAVWVLALLMRRSLARHAALREAASRAAFYTLSRLATYGLYAVGVMFALSFLGIETSRFAVVAGAIGVGLGFGLQAIFSNFVSGIILLFERTLRVGDFVELSSGLRGEVRDINIRSTLISTNDNVDILVPNSEFVTGRVVNWTLSDLSRRIRVPFGIAYGSDKELVKKAALEAAAEVPFTLAQDGPRRPQVWLVGFGDSSLNFELVVWLTPEATKRPSAVEAAYLWALETALGRHGLEVPFPQRDLHLRSVFGLEQEAAQVWLRGQPQGQDQVAEEGPSPEPRDPPRTPRGASEVAGLDTAERASLARNDAIEEVERAGREAARQEADRSAASEPEVPR